MDLTSHTPVITFGQKMPFIEEFVLEIHLPSRLEDYRSEIIRVLTSGYEMESATQCPQTAEYKKCLYIGEFKYKCVCQNYCQLSIKISFVSDWVRALKPLEVCGIQC